MRSFLGTLVIAVIVVAGLYAYLQHRSSSSAERAPSEAGTAQANLDRTARDSAEDRLEQEAREYIRDITTIKPQPLSAQSADNFVQRDQTIRLVPDTKVENTTPKKLLAEPGLEPDTPLTVIKEVDQIEIVTADTLRQSGGDPAAPIRVMEGDAVRETTVGDLLAERSGAADTPMTIVKKVKQVQATTPREIGENASIAMDEEIGIVRGRQPLDEATVAELMSGKEKGDADSIYYIRTVRETDTQGIWGIIQYGLIDNFAAGIAIRKGENINTYRVDIPGDADEMGDARTSSFLGRMIHRKAGDTFVYNLDRGRIGQNPDMIHPGQELLIIRFSAEELVAIYKHFVNNRA